MAEGREVTKNSAEVAADVVDEAAVQLVYRLQPADTLVGLRVRKRIKRWGCCCGACSSHCGWGSGWWAP